MHTHPLFALFGIIVASIYGSAAGAETALDRYIAKPDDAYSYSLYHTDSTLTYTSYFLKLISQNWRHPDEVDRTLWEHELQITVPAIRHTAAPETALLIINGGGNDAALNTETGELLSSLAIATGAVVAQISRIPNQPLWFSDEDDRRRIEDAIIAYSLDKFLTTRIQNGRCRSQ